MLKTRKIISMILTVCMLMSLVSTVAFAGGANVAKVGDTEYSTLQEAINAAADGDTVYLLSSVSESQPITISKSITIDGDGNCLTYTGTNRAIDIKSSSELYNVNITELEIVADNAQRGINFNNGGKLNLSNVIFESNKSDKATYAINLPGSSDGAEVTIENSVLKGLIALNIWGEGVKVNATATEFISYDYSEAEDYAAIVLNDDGETAAENTVVTLTNCEVSATTETGAQSQAIFNATKTGRVDYDDATVINGTVIAPVAIIHYDNNMHYAYTTLQDAIDRAIKDNKAVEIINNITQTDIITIDGAVTINGNGYKLISTASRAINVDTTAQVTINDLVVEAKGGCQRGINIINKAGTTNLNNVTVYGETHYAVHVATSAGAAVVNVDQCDLTGYGAVATYGSGSNVTVTDSNLTGINIYKDNGSNSFATIAAGGEDIIITVTGGKVVAESTEGLAQQMVAGSIKGSIKNLTVTIDAEIETKGTAVIMGFDPADNPSLKFRAEYKDKLLAEGFAISSTATEGIIGIDFTKEVFTVTYVADDNTVAVVYVQEGANVETVPEVPAKDGFTGKWNSDGTNITADTVITAVYTKKEVEQPKPEPEVEIVDTKEIFTDVAKDEWYKEYVDYAYSHKLLVGMSETEYGVDEALTRGMFVTVLARIHGIDTGADANKDAKPDFTDVKAGEYYSKAVEWAKKNGVVAGYEDGTFKPNATVSRQELCKMLANYVEFAKVTLKDDKAAIDFADADKIGDWAKSAVTACQKAGIVVGYELNSKTYFGPQDTATRAQGSVILAKFHSEYVK